MCVLQYYPPDFDPAKLPRGQRGNKDAQMKVSAVPSPLRKDPSAFCLACFHQKCCPSMLRLTV